MARFYGIIGYAHYVETSPGVTEEVITEYGHYGDIIRNIRRMEADGRINDNIVVNNQISIIATDFAFQNFQFMKYVKYLGTCWKITNVEIMRPRLLLSIGEPYVPANQPS